MDERTEQALELIERQFGKSTAKFAPKQLVATYSHGVDKVTLFFATGNFDDWAVVVNSGNRNYPKVPTDAWYFSILKDWCGDRSAQDIYADFVKIFDMTTNKAKRADTAPVVEEIEKMAWNYPDYLEACAIFTILYMGMIAEENKAGKILGKRIKRLGVHQVLLEGVHPKIAADFSRGKPATALTMECYNRGF